VAFVTDQQALSTARAGEKLGVMSTTNAKNHPKLADMTVEEKASLTAGQGTWNTPPIDRLGIPPVYMTDGPAGARGVNFPGIGVQTPSICIPCGSAIGATWNTELVEKLGAVLGTETRRKGSHLLLAPTVNIHRSPLGGRSFECYSEDPLLSGKTAAAFIRGLQSEGAAATVKHFVCNDQEFERMTIDVVVDQRTLREIYLVPFELAVREGNALAIMTAYNRLNSVYCAENEDLFRILREEWGFEGIVMTDWFGGASTAGAAKAGLDLQMPAPDRFYGARLAEAVRTGEVPEAELDAIANRMLTLFDELDVYSAKPNEYIVVPELDETIHRELTRQAAAESMVLLANNGTLPLNVAATKSVAVIGPNAATPRIMGGGSAEVMPRTITTLLDALNNTFGADKVTFEKGCDIDLRVPLASARLLSPTGEQGFSVDVFPNTEWTGEPKLTVNRADGRAMLLTGQDRGIGASGFSFRATSTYTTDVSGPHHVAVVQVGPSRVTIDGRVIFDGITNAFPKGEAFFGMGSDEFVTTEQFEADRKYEIVVEYQGLTPQFIHGAQIGIRAVPPTDLMDRAVASAAKADVALVVVGTNNDWESEGYDRKIIALPGDQDELVRRVAAVNKKTIVVVNTGAPVAMPWVNDVAGVIHVWFGGEEMAGALTEVLTGVTDPSGRLPTTFPKRIEDTPAFDNFPGEHSQLRYGEGLFVGYRWYDRRHIAPAFPFGFGLSYATFETSAPVLSAQTIDAEALAKGSLIAVKVPVRNTSARRGASVVQCYIAPLDNKVSRPEQELKGFTKLWLDAGASGEASMNLDFRSFASWDPGDVYKSRYQASITGALLNVDVSNTGSWIVEPGRYEIRIADSAANTLHTAVVTIS
jgi:beta-glucosidase